MNIGKTILTEHIDTLPWTIRETQGVSIISQRAKSVQKKGIVVVDIADTDFGIPMALACQKERLTPEISALFEIATDTKKCKL